MIEINEIHLMDCMDLMASLPEKSVQLIIADPPYFGVKGDFDFVWDSFDDYLKDVERWAVACKRVLAENGSLYWWGHAKKIAYSQIILDRFFCLENSIAWYKTDCQTRKGRENFRSFAPVTERLLFYSNGTEPGEWNQTGWESVKLDVANFQPLRDYFRIFQENLGLTKKAIVEKIGQRADHCFRHSSSQWDMPTPETYKDLLGLPLQNGWKPTQYEELRRFFKNSTLDDIWFFSQDVHETGKNDHDTKKPERIAAAIIETSSRPGDTVLVPFAGSGTECAMSVKLGRNFYGCDIDPKHVGTASKRVASAKAGLIPRTAEEVKLAGGEWSLFDL